MSDKEVAIWQAKEAFVADGMMIQVGDTVAGGHPILKGRGIFFQPFVPLYDHKRDKALRDAALEDQLAAEAQAEADAKKAAEEAISYVDLQAEAKALGLPASGKRKELQKAVDAAKEAAVAAEAETKASEATKAGLLAQADAAGVEVDADATKTEIAEKLVEAGAG
jgi:hypothetical protein